MELTEFQASQLARAADDIAGYLDGLKVDLYQTAIAFGPTTPLATFTAAVCTYTGYAQGVVTWSTPTLADDGTVEVLGTLPVWRPTDGVTPNVAWGIYAHSGVGSVLYFAGQFDGAPLPMQSALQQITVTLRYRPATRTLAVVVS